MDNQCQLNPHHFTLQQECFLNRYPTQTQSCFHKWIHFRLKCGGLVLLGVINKWYKDPWNPPWWYSAHLEYVWCPPFSLISFCLHSLSLRTEQLPGWLSQVYHLSISVVNHMFTTSRPCALTYSPLPASSIFPAHIVWANICDCVYSIWEWLFLNPIAPWTTGPSPFRPLAFHCLHFIPSNLPFSLLWVEIITPFSWRSPWPWNNQIPQPLLKFHPPWHHPSFEILISQLWGQLHRGAAIELVAQDPKLRRGPGLGLILCCVVLKF